MTISDWSACATACATCSDDSNDTKCKQKPQYEPGKTLPWPIEFALIILAGPIAFKVAVWLFTLFDS